MSEDGMSLSFKEFGLDKIEGKLKRVENSTKAIARITKAAGTATGGNTLFSNALSGVLVTSGLANLTKAFAQLSIATKGAAKLAKFAGAERAIAKVNKFTDGALGVAFSSVGRLVAGATAALAAPVSLVGAGVAIIGAVAVASIVTLSAYFKLDKTIKKGWEYISKKVGEAGTFIGAQVSKAADFWQTQFARLTRRGDFLPAQYNLDRMKYVIDIKERQNYTDIITQDLYAAGDSFAVDTQREEMKKLFEDSDKKNNRLVTQMAEYLAFQERD